MIQIQIDTEGIQEATNQLMVELDRYKTCLKAITLITNKEEIISIEELNEVILKGTNFRIVDKVAELKGFYSAYVYYKDNLGKWDLSNYDENLEIKKEVLDNIENLHSTYFDKETESVYRKLDKVVDVLNSINRAYANCLVSDYNGHWSINKLALHNISNELSKQI